MMKKFTSVLLILVLLCGLCLTGCHGNKQIPEFAVPDEFDTSKTYELTFWAKNDTNKTQTEIYQKAIDDFQELYPNVHISMRLYTDYGKIYNDVITNIATQTTPNICITYPDHIATYMKGSNIVVPLDELIDDEDYGLGGAKLLFDSPKKNEVVSEFLGEGVLDGVQYAVPFMRSSEATYINKTYVEKLGYTIPDVLTWDFIWEVSNAAMAKDSSDNFKVNGQKVMIPFIYKSTDNMMIQMLRQSGGEYSTEDGEILIFNDQTKAILSEVQKAAETESFSTFKISSYPANFLNAGQCIFAIDSTAGATWMGTEAPLLDISEDKLVEFETVVRPVPQYDAKNISMISQGPSICIFNKADAGEVMASWLFTQFMLTNDVQIAYAQTEGYVPVTTKAQRSSEYKKYLSLSGSDNELHYSIKIDATKLLLENTSNTFTTPVFNGSASLRDAAGQMIENVVKAVRRKQSVDFDKTFDEVYALYRLGEVGGRNFEKGELEPMPQESIIMFICLGAAWILILIIFLAKRARKKRIGKTKLYRDANR